MYQVLIFGTSHHKNDVIRTYRNSQQIQVRLARFAKPVRRYPCTVVAVLVLGTLHHKIDAVRTCRNSQQVRLARFAENEKNHWGVAWR